MLDTFVVECAAERFEAFVFACDVNFEVMFD